jgi:hypothetical protein
MNSTEFTAVKYISWMNLNLGMMAKHGSVAILVTSG